MWSEYEIRQATRRIAERNSLIVNPFNNRIEGILKNVDVVSKNMSDQLINELKRIRYEKNNPQGNINKAI